MNMWKILDIDYTEDISVIKKAYAKKLKLYHPEDDAQGYQTLREAYDMAIKNAKNKNKIREAQTYKENTNETPSMFENTPQFSFNEENPFADNSFEVIPKINITEFDQYSNDDLFTNRMKSFIMKLEEAYLNFDIRINKDTWINILNDDIMWEISNKQAVLANVIEFFESHYNLPKEIWMLIEDAFSIQDYIEDQYYTDYSALKSYIYRVLNLRSMSFDFIKDIEYEAREKYIEIRLNVIECEEKRKLDLVYSYIYDAKEIFDKDPELLCLEGVRLSLSGDYVNAILALSRALDIFPEFEIALLNRGKAYERCRDYQKAKVDFENLLLLRPNDEELSLILSHLYLKLDDPISSRILLKKLDASGYTKKDVFIPLLERTDFALINMSKKAENKNNTYFLNELPEIVAEFKAIKKGNHGTRIKEPNAFSSQYLKLVTFVVITLIVLFFINTINKWSDNHIIGYGNTLETQQILDELKNEKNITDESQNENDIELSPLFKVKDLENLAQTCETISITINNAKLLNLYIFEIYYKDTKIEDLLPIASEDDTIDDLRQSKNFQNLCVGEVGGKSLLFSGDYSSLQKLFQNSEDSNKMKQLKFLKKITFKGVVVENDSSFTPAVLEDLKNIGWNSKAAIMKYRIKILN